MLGKQVNFKTTEGDVHAIVAAMTIHNICIILSDEIEFESRAPSEIPTNNAAIVGTAPIATSKREKIARSLVRSFWRHPV